MHKVSICEQNQRFFYNKNDIIIVLIILIAAGLIIYTRINAIMDYPETFAQQNAKAQQTTQAADKESKAAASSEAVSQSSSASDTVSISILSSDSTIAVAQKLYQAGLVDSDTEFQSYISNKGKENSLKSGTFQIPKNATDEQILNIIAN